MPIFGVVSVFVFSLVMVFVIVATKGLSWGGSAQNHDISAVQAAHFAPTPRLGGVAIYLAVLLGIALLPATYSAGLWALALSAVPVAIVGLIEDVTHKVSPAVRFLASIVSGAVAIIALGFWVDHMDAPILGALVGIAPIGIMFTLFLTASFSHAFNLIDGLNGLSSGVACVCAAALAMIAFQANVLPLAMFCLLYLAAIMGFLVFNFPAGKVFLGDAGAYTNGHLMAWVSLGLYATVPNLTCWAILLIFFWPTADTVFAVFRRTSRGQSIGAADRMHFHQVVMRFLEIHWLGRAQRQLSNPLATLIILPMAAFPAALGVALMDQPLSAFLALISCGGVFIITYNILVRLARVRDRTRLSGERTARAAA
jgi:UDP-N-acetylmuramyl pentapeptide phosphotransferase/UDP-N-acetylglucosamine-1-phosphate transferase